MIDTHGLPMKFEFCLGSHMDRKQRNTWIIDFNDARNGNPILYRSDCRDDCTYDWTAHEIIENLEDGRWVLLTTFDEVLAQVEDLL